MRLTAATLQLRHYVIDTTPSLGATWQLRVVGLCLSRLSAPESLAYKALKAPTFRIILMLALNLSC